MVRENKELYKSELQNLLKCLPHAKTLFEKENIQVRIIILEKYG